MKPGKIIGIILLIIVVLLILAYFINRSNKQRTADAITNQTKPNPTIIGRFVATSNLTDYTELVNDRPKWLWGGRGGCQSGYTKILDGQDAGWCFLTQSENKMKPVWNPPVGKQWCCANNNEPCDAWKLCDIAKFA